MSVQRHERGPRTPSTQLYYGPLYADSLAIRRLALLGQVNPSVSRRMRRQHGRHLSGLGSEMPSGRTGYDPAYQDQGIYELEEQDDTFGSGIFDPGSRGGTSNANMGVFASHYSLPGYAAREVPFTVSQDESDITDDAAVVPVPSGGMSYVEHRGKLTRPAVLGPTWRPPRIEPAGVTRRDQVYAFMTRPAGYGEEPSRLQEPLNAGAPQLPPPTYRPPRDSKYHETPLPTSPSCQVPRRPTQTRLPRASRVEPAGAGIAIRPPRPCPPRRQPSCPSGLGAEEGASKGQLLAFGLLAGAATAMVVNLTKGKRR